LDSLAAANAPQHILAALEVFQFHNPSSSRLNRLSESERSRFFQWCDDRQLTLMLPHVCGSLPRWVSQTVQDKATRYNIRFERIKRELFDISAAFDQANLSFVMLKGLSHSPALTPEPSLRGQGDLDFWFIDSSIYKALDVLERLGYAPTLPTKGRHLPPMSRPSKWKWQGDLHDSAMPISVELHYELWSDTTDFIPAPGVTEFWSRKKLRYFDDYAVSVLSDQDLLGFAALHLLLHVLHGELPLQRAWEIARFLHYHDDDHAFWRSWRSLHPTGLRELEICMFCLVAEWFGCNWPKDLNPEVQHLRQKVVSALSTCSSALLATYWKPNKSELALHLALAEEPRHRFRILVRRLIPLSIPVFVDSATTFTSWHMRALATVRQAPRLSRRFVRHATTFFPTLFDGLRWFSIRKS
jgi:hypothetical protein